MSTHQKFKAGETHGTYVIDGPVTEQDILQMARALACRRFCRGLPFTGTREVFPYLQTLLADYEHEVFATVFLDSRHRSIAYRKLFTGTIDHVAVPPREVVKAALVHNAAAVILVHNHPSGDPEPSECDLTAELNRALALVGVRILDHIVVANEGCVSLAERGYL
ncbi:RadC family protein [Pseudomonas sp. MAG002Y]|uniref:JAB domain-containing protein n=1 Tax=Pseudomonas sp. MAG002Y TaxID=2678690 RepID=UPI001C60C963|nr:JAB domain-containing protein [Pseudomonas sp. MAG002Y]MBW5415235.1 DNA repair protein RadC [Pseudomonas sp. MAG002Y]